MLSLFIFPLVFLCFLIISSYLLQTFVYIHHVMGLGLLIEQGSIPEPGEKPKFKSGNYVVLSP